MSFSRGQICVVAQKGVYSGKPRPALLIQAEALDDHDSLLFCLIYTAEEMQTGAFFRIPVQPSEANGIDAASTIAVDKVVSIRRDKVGQLCGFLEEDVMGVVNDALIIFQGLG